MCLEILKTGIQNTVVTFLALLLTHCEIFPLRTVIIITRMMIIIIKQLTFFEYLQCGSHGYSIFYEFIRQVRISCPHLGVRFGDTWNELL